MENTYSFQSVISALDDPREAHKIRYPLDALNFAHWDVQIRFIMEFTLRENGGNSLQITEHDKI